MAAGQEVESGMDDSVPGRAQDRHAVLLAQADLCVKCGLCLPHCPTYRLTGTEAESPRGRIALVQGLATGALTADDAREPLDHCLACRACERVCPSEVPYGALIDRARRELPGLSQDRRADRLLRWATATLPVRHPRLVAGALSGRSGRAADALARRLGRGRGALARLARYAPGPMPPWQAFAEHHPPPGPERGRVALFLGCIARVLDQDVLRDAIVVLNAAGIHVVVPPGQGCCGALHAHAGDAGGTLASARANLAAFGDAGVDAVVSCASGCGAHLAEYGGLAGLDSGERAAAGRVGASVRDVTTVLAEAGEALRLGPYPGTVAVHEPCSLRMQPGAVEALVGLLGRIPEARIRRLEAPGTCCGAAGSYMLRHPELADPLGDRRLATIDAVAPDMVVSANIGCAMHLRARARSRGGPAPRILHPVQLLRACLA
jgi:glycolate oxidase iron-sulfur subunit